MVRITTNMPALMAWRQSGEAGTEKDSLSMERLTKDLRVRTDDDRVKPDISEKMRDRIRHHNQVVFNVQQEITQLQTAAAELEQIHSHLQDLRELVQPEPDKTGIADAQINLEQIDSALSHVTLERERLLEALTHLENSLGSLLTAGENLSASESLIRESDTALASLNLTRYQINLDSKQALLAQGNLEHLRTAHLLFHNDS